MINYNNPSLYLKILKNVLKETIKIDSINKSSLCFTDLYHNQQYKIEIIPIKEEKKYEKTNII